MRAVLDANILFPTILREILADLGAAGLYDPVWSARILEEWRRAAARLGSDQEVVAGAEIALLTDRFPDAIAADDGVRTI
ncbi:MAG TPA: PIN domain-containing protein, partial [Paracoccus sp.]|nr:PIN domain-containing protein [Paracoccus sp. (in: a-proteobacteria)]